MSGRPSPVTSITGASTQKYQRFMVFSSGSSARAPEPKLPPERLRPHRVLFLTSAVAGVMFDEKE
jgi:hypothetical protein